MGQELKARYAQVRQRSLELVAPLQPEDVCLQGMADASPPKWHLGHTTWFFEQFVLRSQVSPDAWGFLFNSYYDSVGARHPRPQRGLLSRPALAEVRTWRQRLDGALLSLLEQLEPGDPRLELVELGLQHEQQHQELLLMDLLDGFSRNPLEPAYGPEPEAAYQASVAQEPTWLQHEGGLVEIGHPGGSFHFDNEAPRHRRWLEPFALSSRLVSNGEYAAFIADGGYKRPELWMSEGWAVAQARGWLGPRYWRDGEEFSLAGRQPRRSELPVRHLSWFEADAYSRWAGARLPGEAEWELLAPELEQAFGVLWQWSASPYRPYPGFAPAAGAVGEYNGKFMSSQMVLRGSCFLTPPGHERLTYRNFYPPASRWLAAGLRLARDGG
jgi:ergothioneine biosynthesis protein EgtB